METRELVNYELDIIDITEFKSYYYENRNSFTGVATNSFLKALDIPPKFFKEQPEETQAELLDNREVFVREHKKYFNKVIVVLKTKFNETLNAARLDKLEADKMYEKLSCIKEVSNKFEHRSFVKDGYISIIVSNDIEKNTDNQVVAIDFPILMNKNVVVHNALYTLPNESFATPIEHIHYLSSEEISLSEGSDFSNIKEVVEHYSSFLNESIEKPEDEQILRETEIVTLALAETAVIPKSALEKVGKYISSNSEAGLSTSRLENLVLDFDETFNSYKQVTSLRSVNGHEIKAVLESDTFKEFVEEMETVEI